MNKKSRKTVLVVLLCVVLAAALALAATMLREKKMQFDENAVPMSTENAASANSLSQGSGMFTISIAAGMVCGMDGKGTINLVNVPENDYLMQADIVLQDGRTVYSSQILAPGEKVEQIQLTEKLSPGKYSASAVINAITPDNRQVVGGAEARLIIYITDENGNIPQT